MVTLDEFTKNIEIELDDLESGTLTSDINYRDLEQWSSMYALIIIAYVDSEYNVTLTGDDLRSCNTVRDLYLLIKSRV
ncbi:MAG: acyl carrier protein [Bacteroidetes bacterium RIFCSPLOWO2_12_FULL_31_6]|nr:MAG: acyl carrier protein [Bacteroidetes bacterium RIFCSPLOWO2_12_FULL_31_6]